MSRRVRDPSPQESPLLTQGSTASSSTPPPSTPSTPYEYRWSDVVPPQTALKFAVVWDEEDIVVFSAGELEDSRTEDLCPNSPSDADAYSQVLSLGRSSTTPLSDKASTMMCFQENMGSLLDPSTPHRMSAMGFRRRRVVGRTQTSSTLEGLDVYLRGSLLGQAHRIGDRYYSCLEDLDGEFEFDPRTSFAKQYVEDKEDQDDVVTDEGFYEVSIVPRQRRRVERDLKHSSVHSNSISSSTGDASEFVTIDTDDASSIWSTVEAPELPFYHSRFDQRPVKNRLKKKSRPAHVPAPPSEVLRREVFGHQVSLPPPRANAHEEPRPARLPVHKKSLVKLIPRISKSKKTAHGPGGDQWICVEVSHEVRQRFI
jgi:hypothetical protein